MANIPGVSTDTWRLPPKSHAKPESSFTNDMYRRVGLPTAETSAAGGGGAPSIDTSDWKLPVTARPLEEAEGTEASEGTKFSFLVKRARKQDVGPKRQPDDDAVEEGKFDAEETKAIKRVAEGLADVIERLKSKPDDGYAIVRALKQVVRDAREERIGSYTDLESNMKFLDALVRRTDGAIDPKQAKHTAGNLTADLNDIKDRYREAFAKGESAEDTMQRQRRLAGLSRDEHLTFATGTPYRRLPDGRSAQVPLSEEAPDERVLVRQPSRPALTPEMKRLAGITESVSLPRPLHDTRSLQAPKAHGILDDGQDDGEAYVESVLASSRWFFEQTRPFAEAPGGRRPPWRGSDDEPAETPIVRKGEVQGVVGKTKSPEAHGEVDVGKSEIDYDHDPDEEHEKQTDAHKPKPKPGEKAKAAPEPEDEEPEDEEPEEPEEEPEDDEDDEETDEDVQEARDREGGAGSGLKALGRGLKAAGHRMSSGSAAQRAKTGLAATLQRFAAKHGIDTDVFHAGRRSAQRELSGKAAEAERKKQAAKKGKKAKPGTSGGGMPPKSSGGGSAAAPTPKLRRK